MKIEAAAHSEQGLRQTMEDEHVLLVDMNAELGLPPEQANAQHAFFAVYDGHGGKKAASYARNNLHHNIVKSPYFKNDLRKAVQEAYLKTDKEFLEKAQKEGVECGTTAVTAVIRDKKLVVGNAGDSRAVICRGGKAIELSKDHKPEVPHERARIEAAGGWVMRGAVCGCLGVSRALGDIDFKRNKHEMFGRHFRDDLVTAQPDVTEHDLNESDEFMVLACDGLWDVMSSQQVVDLVRSKLRSNPTTSSPATSPSRNHSPSKHNTSTSSSPSKSLNGSRDSLNTSTSSSAHGPPSSSKPQPSLGPSFQAAYPTSTPTASQPPHTHHHTHPAHNGALAVGVGAGAGAVSAGHPDQRRTSPANPLAHPNLGHPSSSPSATHGPQPAPGPAGSTQPSLGRPKLPTNSSFPFGSIPRSSFNSSDPGPSQHRRSSLSHAPPKDPAFAAPSRFPFVHVPSPTSLSSLLSPSPHGPSPTASTAPQGPSRAAIQQQPHQSQAGHSSTSPANQPYVRQPFSTPGQNRYGVMASFVGGTVNPTTTTTTTNTHTPHSDPDVRPDVPVVAATNTHGGRSGSTHSAPPPASHRAGLAGANARAARLPSLELQPRVSRSSPTNPDAVGSDQSKLASSSPSAWGTPTNTTAHVNVQVNGRGAPPPRGAHGHGQGGANGTANGIVNGTIGAGGKGERERDRGRRGSVEVLKEASAALVQEALKTGSMDNVSAVVVRFKHS